MRGWVAEWVEDGKVWVWCYENAEPDWRGWHMTADPSGCRSIRNLLDRMNGCDACSRQIALQPVPDNLLQNVGHTQSIAPQLPNIEIQFTPDVMGMSVQKSVGKLELKIGNARIRKLAAAFAQVEIGHGDFTLATEFDRFFFWWPPR